MYFPDQILKAGTPSLKVLFSQVLSALVTFRRYNYKLLSLRIIQLPASTIDVDDVRLACRDHLLFLFQKIFKNIRPDFLPVLICTAALIFPRSCDLFSEGIVQII